MSGFLGQVALASMEDDRLVVDEIAHHDGVGDVVGLDPPRSPNRAARGRRGSDRGRRTHFPIPHLGGSRDTPFVIPTPGMWDSWGMLRIWSNRLWFGPGGDRTRKGPGAFQAAGGSRQAGVDVLLCDE